MTSLDAPASVPSAVSRFDVYRSALAEYFNVRSESALYRASLLSQSFVESGLGPEDIVALHFEALDQVLGSYSYREQARVIGDAHQFLLEVMIAYGVRYKEYLELKLSETLREAERRAAVDEERQRELERIGREKEEILAVIAHELRTPITAARGSVDMVTRWLGKGDLERVPRLLETTREALDRLSRLSADLVEASRGQPAPMGMVPLDLMRVLDQTCNWALPAAASKDIDLRRPEQGVECRILGNADALLTLFGNLLSNAVRYTPNGGHVEVRVGRAGDEAIVEVVDTGIGMPPAVQTRIFEKFYRAPEAQATENRGLGLGLSLVMQMVHAHRGRIEVHSTAGEGSTFRVYLPIAKQDNAEGATE